LFKVNCRSSKEFEPLIKNKGIFEWDIIIENIDMLLVLGYVHRKILIMEFFAGNQPNNVKLLTVQFFFNPDWTEKNFSLDRTGPKYQYN
jgi:hypothetical protein